MIPSLSFAGTKVGVNILEVVILNKFLPCSPAADIAKPLAGNTCIPDRHCFTGK